MKKLTCLITILPLHAPPGPKELLRIYEHEKAITSSIIITSLKTSKSSLADLDYTVYDCNECLIEG